MSRIWLVRHGQAGTRKAYDALSDLGRKQARLLGEYFAGQGIRWAAAYSGELIRQQQTAQEVRAAAQASGAEFPDIQIERRWNEFDLDQVYRSLAPQLAAGDPEFHREYEGLRAQARAAADDPHAAVHRRWLPSDVKIISAWVTGSHPYEGETWEAFCDRVTSIDPAAERDSDIVVFTSATPIGVWTARTMDITDERAMKLAGALHNASYTVIKLNGAESRLHTFNATPHLATAGLRTWR
jgi:broad specificity phosphatase PhoE